MEVKQKKAMIAAKALRNVISWMMIETRAREKEKMNSIQQTYLDLPKIIFGMQRRAN